MASVVSCAICYDADQSLRYFHVPNNLERLREWCNVLDGVEIKSSSIVCEKHFLEEHFTKNKELNCWRLNSKAIPTLSLTVEKFGSYKLINEDLFDNDCDIEQSGGSKRNSKTVSTQTNLKDSMKSAYISCLWCDACFNVQDVLNFLKHIGSRHSDNIETLFKLSADNDSFEVAVDDVDEDTLDFQDDADFEMQSVDGNLLKSNDDANERVMKTKICPLNSSEDEHDPTVNNFKIEECYVDKDDMLNSNYLTDEEGNIDELFTSMKSAFDCKQEQTEEPTNKMLPVGEESNNQINLETSDESLVFYIIELLQTFPALWFINGYKTKQYEAALVNLCIQFSQKYEYYMTQLELHESLIEIRDWYQKIFEEQSMEELLWPQSEYYERLAEFLPDKENGKTCMLCQRLFNDHLQYFGHKKLVHGQQEENEQNIPEETPLKYLKDNANNYFNARYPLYIGGFSHDCQVCPRQLNPKNKLKFLEHIISHLNIRNHVCDICGKSFAKKDLFKIHRNRHFGLHKFECKICVGKFFTNGSLLTSHRKRYHRPLEGTLEQIEKMQKIIRNNRRTFSECCVVAYKDGDVTRFACAFCDRPFKYRGNVYKHCRNYHKDKMMKKKATKTNENTNEIQSIVDMYM